MKKTGLILASLLLSTAFIVFADDVSTQVTVGNATPSATNPTFNGGGAITLTENTTTTVYATTTVTDTNGCETIVGVTMDFYRSGVGTTSCDTIGEADENYCYPRVSCSVAGGSCTGPSDTSADYVCSVDLEYYADPTDSGTYAAEIWNATVYAGDGIATTTGNTGTAEVNTLLALDVTSSINYGTLSPNTDTGADNATTTVTNTGNGAIDPEVSGTDMTSVGDTITVGYQEYATTSFTYGAGTDLTGSGVRAEIDLPQRTTSVVQALLLWGIGIPAGQPSGTYTGTNTFTAIAD